MPIEILASADLHLGRSSSEFGGRPEEASVKRSWKKLLDHAVSHKVDLLLLAGDIVDQDNKYFEAIGALQEGFEKLEANGIETILVAGNHDHDVLPSIIERASYEKVHLLGRNGKWEAHLFEKSEGEKLRILGWSFPERYFEEDPVRDPEFPRSNDGIPTIGLLHGDLDIPESPYAPIASEALEERGSVNAWVLGHIHKGGVRKEKPLILYPGSLQALSPKETGLHGAYSLSVESSAAIRTRSIPLSPVRYEQVRVDVSDARNKEELRSLVDRSVQESSEEELQQAPDTERVIYDVILEGRSAYKKEIPDQLEDLSSYERTTSSGTLLTVRKLIDRVEAELGDLRELSQDPSTPVGRLAATIRAIEEGKDDPFLQELRNAWEEKRRELVGHPTYGPVRDREEGGTKIADRYILEECRNLLLTLQDQGQNANDEKG